MLTSERTTKKESAPRTTWLQRIGLFKALIAFLLPWWVEFPGLSEPGHRVFAIFLLAIVLWVTEAIPLHATAAVIIFLEILLVSDKSFLALPAGFSAPRYNAYYGALAHPVIMLFLGGFFLADGSAKYHLDRNLARILLRPFGDSPGRILLGLMLITALLSMFMSNTATTATMMAVVLPVILSLPKGDRMRTGLALCIPVAANVGGIGTPVGTPPNAIALGAMAEVGVSISFLQWMGMALPCMIILLLFSWQLLCRLFPCSQKQLTFRIDAQFDTSGPAVLFYAVAACTILLWLTEPLHHVKSTVVGFLPVVILLSTRVFTTRDLQTIQWHVLWLVAGGIALGVGVSASGLDTWLIGLVQWEQIWPALIPTVICLAALAMGTLISHSATANLLVPVGISLASSGEVSLSPMMAAFFIAIGSSLAMALPISTPPNAIAHSTGAVETKHMLLSGLLIGAVGLLLYVLLAPLLWSWMGITPPP